MRQAGTLLLLATLAACSRGEQAQQAAQEGDRVRCALAGAKDFAPDCTREVVRSAGGEAWTIRHPDGGFRRFVLIEKGTRIAAADGADEVQTTQIGPDLEVRVADSRYLFPAAPAAPAASDAPAS